MGSAVFSNRQVPSRSRATVLPVPPAVIGRAALASTTRSSTVALYFALSIVVLGLAVVPAGLLYTPDPSLGIFVLLYNCMAHVSVP